MCADHRRKPAVGGFGTPRVALIFRQPLPTFVRPIAIRDFVAQHTAATDFGDSRFKRRQAPVDGVRRRMVIDESGRAAAQRRQRRPCRSFRRSPACAPDPAATR